MACTEDFHMQLIEPLKSNTLHNETSLLSTSTTMFNNSTPPMFPVSPLTKSDETVNKFQYYRITAQKSIPVKRMSLSIIARQLTVRKVLQNRLRSISNVMCFFGLLGIILMIIENEITFARSYNKDTIISWCIKLIITTSTIILIGLIFYYHHSNLRLYSVQNSLVSWYSSLTIKKIFLITLEILICFIHPIPRYFLQNWIGEYREINVNSTLSNLSSSVPVSPSHIDIDVALGLPMFARLYLICRCIMFHSHLVRNAPFKSFGSLNQVSINFTFLMKIYIEKWPTRCLSIFCILMFFIGSWSIRACDYQHSAKHISMFDSMWLFIVTYTTVGYGDLTPSTYCGRTVASIIALIGVLITALLISVFAQKLELTRGEKYVHNFVSDIELTRERRKQSANIIKFSIKVWYLKRKNRSMSVQYLKVRQRLAKSIDIMRKIKDEQRKLADNCLSIVELINIQRYTSVKTKRIIQEVTTMKLTMAKIEERINDMNHMMNNIHNKLNLVLNNSKE